MSETDISDSATRRADAVKEVNDVAAEYAQAALEALHAEDILGHIPIVRTALAAAKAVGSLRDHLLLKKIGIFLYAISSIPSADRRAMVQKLGEDPAFDESLGEHLIELLDRLDGRRKPAMVGAVFAAYAFAQIDAKTLRRLNSAIQHLPICEVDSLRTLDAFNKHRAGNSSDRHSGPDRISMQSLSTAGLAEPEFLQGGTWYHLNEVGRVFLELELDRIRPSDG